MTYEDLLKILQGDNPGDVLLLNLDSLFKLIPELEKCYKYDQDCPKWHPYTLLNHILIALNNSDNDLRVRIALLFHDIAKPDVKVKDDKGSHFPGHGLKSAMVFNQYAKLFTLDDETIITVTKLIVNHDERYSLDTPNEISEFVSQYSPEEIDLLFKVKIADNMAQSALAQKSIPTLIEQRDRILEELQTGSHVNK